MPKSALFSEKSALFLQFCALFCCFFWAKLAHEDWVMLSQAFVSSHGVGVWLVEGGGVG